MTVDTLPQAPCGLPLCTGHQIVVWAAEEPWQPTMYEIDASGAVAMVRVETWPGLGEPQGLMSDE